MVTAPRVGHTATLLSNGTVLIAGGYTSTLANPPAFTTDLANAELYDPTTLSFAATGNMTTARGYHTATLLNNGQALITGGAGANGGVLASAELYDPTTGVFTATGSMTTARNGHTATLLSNGQVLITGGNNGSSSSSYLASAEIYDPTTGVFTATGSMSVARMSDTATLLNDGQVLVAGGDNGTTADLASAELYDPSTGTFSATGNMTDARFSHTATLLSNGQVLVAGGYGAPSSSCEQSPVWNAAELYDPTTGAFSATGSMTTPRYLHTATLLSNNLVLFAAGNMGPTFNPDCGIEYPPTLNSAELYDPVAGTFTATASLLSFVQQHTATLLNDGTVLVAGGITYNGIPNPSAEIFETTFASVIPAFLSFGNETVGTTNTNGQIVTLKNSDGSSALNITQVTINGTNPSDFAETDNCLGSIAVGVSCTITVTFTPGGAGTRTGNVVIVNNNDSFSSLKVPLTGTGFVGPAAASLSPSTLVFGAQAAGTSSAPQTVYLTDSGNSALNIQTVAIGASSDFVIGSGTTCTNGSSVAINGSCIIQVIFTPATSGQKSATLTITDNAPGSPQQISLSGSSPAVTVSVSPTSVSFASQLVGTSGAPQTVTLANSSSLPLTITSVTASPADFATLSACGSTLAANSSCAIGVFFDPTAGGTRTGTLTITDNATGSPQTVALTGTGQSFSMTAASASATVSAGQTATYSVAIAPAGGFAQNVSLSCGGGPAMSTCSVSPNAIALSGTAAKMATVTVTTAAQAWVLPFGAGRPMSTRRQTPQILGQTAILLSVLLALLWWRREQHSRWSSVFAVALLVCLGMTLTSCGGGSAGGGGGNGGSQAGTYTITVTGNFTSGSTNLTNTAKLTLVVQ